jgi:hypothetical protein
VILPSGAAVGIWRKCENTPGTVCEDQCCTFPHGLYASNWSDPATYMPRDGILFKGLKVRTRRRSWRRGEEINAAPPRYLCHCGRRYYQGYFNLCIQLLTATLPLPLLLLCIVYRHI